MFGFPLRSLGKCNGSIARVFMLGCAILVLRLPLAAQQTGPLPPPPSYKPPAQPKTTPSTGRHETITESPITAQPPSIPVDQIIQRFAVREAEFKAERDNYTYTQTFVIQTIDDYTGRPDGEYRMTSDILFTPAGKRYEKVIDAPQPSLQRIQLEQQDLDDLEHVQPFVLTTAELSKYNVKYVGRQQLDELNTYVFDVEPKTLEKNQRYFQGRVWVEERDLQIVKTDGKAAYEITKKNKNSAFPRFETFRENIEGHYWFPTYTHSEDTLHFKEGGDVRIRMTVRYENYKRFGATIKIGTPVEVPKEKP